MLRLERTLQAWGTSGFEAALKREIDELGAEHLPLQQGLVAGNFVADTPISIMINSIVESGDVLRLHVGVFYRSVIAGCSCADDPAPVSEINEYCEVGLDIDQASAVTEALLIAECQTGQY